MDVVLSALFTVFAAPEAASEMAEMAVAAKKVAPPQTFWGGWNVILGFVLVVTLLAVVAIMVMGLIQLLAKRHELEQPMKDVGPLAKSEMSFFEKLAETRPLFGRLLTVLMMCALAAFFVMTLGSMTNEETFADKLKKEGQEKARLERQRQAEAKEAMGAGAVGEEGERMKTEGLLEAMDAMKGE